MRPAIRYDRKAVSPVIATILLVAITVVLAAVLYVMVSGLLTPVGNGPQIMGVVLSKTGDGKNWSLEIASTPLGLSPTTVHLQLISPGGQTAVYRTFSTLNWPADGAAYFGNGTAIVAGDRLLVDAVRYPTDYQVLISSTTILYSGTLR
ncbi:MAG TPA: archaellin/type IV pilin N-terminal domain-containing protein [Thermoplasmata archaeon]